MRLVLVVALLALAACGADGPPKPPEVKPAPTVGVSGTARVGVVYKS